MHIDTRARTEREAIDERESEDGEKGRKKKKKRKRERRNIRDGTIVVQRGRVERRVRRNAGRCGGEAAGGWSSFDEHGGPSMDVRRGPWRHTRTSPRHPGESKQPYKVAGLRFNPKFISSISKGLSRDPSVSERLTRTTLPSPRERLPCCSPSCLARSSVASLSPPPSLFYLPFLPCWSVGMRAGAPVHRKHTTTL